MSFDYDFHWKGMPEFVNENKEAIAKVTVKFETKEDMEEFGRIVGRTITENTRSIYFSSTEPIRGGFYEEE